MAAATDLSRRGLLAGQVAVGLVLLAGCSTTTVLAPPAAGAATDFSDAALASVNGLRRRRGLSTLSVDPAASRAAIDQALRMAARGRMSHDVGPDRSFLARMKRMDVALPAAENIAAGQAELPAALRAWIESPKHLENMLGRYRGLGVAVARNPATGERPYWAMVLSSPETGLFRM